MRMYRQNAVSLGLTCAHLQALKPPMINVFVADTSTIPIPSTARSATTDSSGFLERAAFGARHLIDRRDGQPVRANLCGYWRADY